MSAAHVNYAAIAFIVTVGVAAPLLLSIAACSWCHADARGLEGAPQPAACSATAQIVYDYRRSFSSLGITLGALVGHQVLIYAVLVPLRLLTEPVTLGIGLVTECMSVIASIVAFNAIRYERRKPVGVFALTFACWTFLVYYVVDLKGPWYLAQ